MALERFQMRIAEKTRDVSAAPLVIVAFGDSVTQGFTRASTIEPGITYHQRFREGLEQLFPLTTFSLINAGVAGCTAEGSMARLGRDVIRYQPDLTLIAFGLNDAVALGNGGASVFKQTLQTMIERIGSETDSDIILLTPNFMVTADNSNIHPDERHYLEGLLPIQKSAWLTPYAEAIRELATEQDIPLADVYQRWTVLAAQGVDTNMMLANGLNHPDAKGHALAAELLLNIIRETE